MSFDSYIKLWSSSILKVIKLPSFSHPIAKAHIGSWWMYMHMHMCHKSESHVLLFALLALKTMSIWKFPVFYCDPLYFPCHPLCNPCQPLHTFPVHPAIPCTHLLSASVSPCHPLYGVRRKRILYAPVTHCKPLYFPVHAPDSACSGKNDSF